jgi:hypothetical protein
MRRFGLEWLLAALLVGALLVLVLLRGSPGDRPDAGPAGSDPALQPTPCLRVAIGAPVRAPSAREADVAGVAEALERIRELRFEEVPEPTYLSPERLARRVTRELDYPRPEAELDRRVLASLEAIPQDLDLRDAVLDLLGGQVAGFYDTDTDELVVGSDLAAGLSAVDLLTLVHELEHALADQRLGVPDIDRLQEQDADAASAALALVEGDAQISTEAYAGRALRPGDLLDAAEASLPELPRTPHFLARSLLFSYAEGARFACALHAEGGWEAVNAAYEDPPVSTDEILFPARYRDGRGPRDPEDPRDLPAPWTPAPPRTFGAADLLFLFEAPGGERHRALPEAMERVRAWAGGEVHLWTRGDRTALALLIAEGPAGEDLCGSVAEWYRRSVPGATDRTEEVPAAELAMDGPRRDAVLLCEGGEVRLGIGPDLRVARAVLR